MCFVEWVPGCGETGCVTCEPVEVDLLDEARDALRYWGQHRNVQGAELLAKAVIYLLAANGYDEKVEDYEWTW